MLRSGSPVSEGCFEFVRHIQTTEIERTTNANGGNVLYFYNTYIKPYINEGNCIIATVTGNTASGQKAIRMMTLPYVNGATSGDGVRVATQRGTAAYCEIIIIGDAYDFHMSAGSVVDVWVYNASY